MSMKYFSPAMAPDKEESCATVSSSATLVLGLVPRKTRHSDDFLSLRFRRDAFSDASFYSVRHVAEVGRAGFASFDCVSNGGSKLLSELPKVALGESVSCRILDIWFALFLSLVSLIGFILSFSHCLLRELRVETLEMIIIEPFTFCPIFIFRGLFIRLQFCTGGDMTIKSPLEFLSWIQLERFIS